MLTAMDRDSSERRAFVAFYQLAAVFEHAQGELPFPLCGCGCGSYGRSIDAEHGTGSVKQPGWLDVVRCDQVQDASPWNRASVEVIVPTSAPYAELSSHAAATAAAEHDFAEHHEPAADRRADSVELGAIFDSCHGGFPPASRRRRNRR
jgi:hypothetical protein